MGRYYYPNENDALSAKIQFLREHHYKINHCFRNTWGTGFVLFDTKEDISVQYWTLMILNKREVSSSSKQYSSVLGHAATAGVAVVFAKLVGETPLDAIRGK